MTETQRGWLHWSFWTVTLAGVAILVQLHYAAAVSVDLSDTVQRNHNIYFGEYGSPKGDRGNADDGAAASMTARYIQLSNGSRFACETTELEHHDPAAPGLVPLNMAVQSAIHSITDGNLPCTHVVQEQYSIVLCWDREVRLDIIAAQTTRVVGRHSLDEPQEYWVGHDSFGPYAATVYGNGEECVYNKQPTVTEVRFYCRYTEFENPIPFLTIYEAAQCHFVLRAMSSKFCSIPRLDHAIETETVHCRMLD
ncbi:hypothetical protein ABB37_03937 [Leptomonas pyrrhocoris]|uniref:MRH domain-containing protein n=1 Tax=Leptomonas pyrrhocoris TaxID=157538 RepID=A0A0M9G3P6_LEPPY|nr:hypothetical protein ABB37_03937 [Leptomonas pyrrhocoris]KPA81603.1 hypothetical protein ABB37_03937 [Leptomonas pyrrhocoris]|eukprot:XP_015660042.1 hypothetical protein ABB37_03937 [Leptomonas pyrrhocoris]